MTGNVWVAGGLQAGAGRVAIHVGHHEVQENQVRLQRGGLRHAVRPIDRLRDGEDRPLQQISHHLPEHAVIVDNKNAGGGHGVSSNA